MSNRFQRILYFLLLLYLHQPVMAQEEEAKEKANRPKDLSYIWDSFPKVSPSLDLLVPVKNIESIFEDSEFHVSFHFFFITTVC
jgi:hypothetical protein